MKSKEALKELFELAVFDNNCNLNKCNKCSVALQKNCGSYQYYKTIKKDLEMLELLKNKLVQPLALMSLPYELYNTLVIKEQQLTQEEYNKIKEWLSDK